MSYGNEALIQSTLRTVDGVYHDLLTIEVPENGMVRTNVTVLAKSATGLAGSWIVQLCAKRFGAAPAVLVQTNGTVTDILKDANWGVQTVVVGNNAVVQAKGSTGIIVDWQYSGSHISFVPPIV